MSQTPFISVIVPMYNVERYIKICINSILAQTFQDFEVIIVDDCSTDNSYKICSELYGNNEKVRIVRHEKNFGLGPARNTGIANARGKYVYFVDSDDVLTPQALDIFHDAAVKTDADVIHTSGYYETDQDNDLPINIKNLKLEWEHYNKVGFLNENILYRLDKCWQRFDSAEGIRPMAWLVCCKKSALEKFNLRFEPIISEDELFSFELLCSIKNVFVIHDALYIYRKRQKSIMAYYNAKRLTDGIFALKFLVDKMKFVMNKIPELKNNLPLQENCIWRMVEAFINNHIKPFYRNGLNADLDKVVDYTLRQIFGDNVTVQKYFFHTSNLNRVNLEKLSAQARQLFLEKQFLNQEIVKTLHRCQTVQNKIVFINFQGKGYGCNPKYIAEEILRQNLNWELVWLVNDLNTPMPEKIRKVKFGSVDASYELSTSKVIVTNVKNYLPFIKKPEQFFIMTWHSDYWVKYIEKDSEDQLSPGYVAESKANSAITDLIISSSKLQTEEIKRTYWYDGNILECGLPRNDIFFNHDKNFIANFKKNLGIPPENKILLYAPTFRDNNFRDNNQRSFEMYKFDAEKLLTLIKKKFGGEWSLLLRFHPNVANLGIAKNLYNISGNIIDVTKYPDPQELIVISDILISDYSSVIYNFTVFQKPTFIFAKDIDTYPKERRLKPFYFELPIKKNKTETELFDCIENFDAKTYNLNIKECLSKIGIYDDGHASEKIVNVIKSVIDKKSVSTLNADKKNDPTPYKKREEWIKDLYRDEIRSGFLVTSHRKKLWNTQIKLINEFARICKKYNLRWFAYGGTLLGAARHGGFVPWDDDTDVAMFRPDYEKFKQVAPYELSYPYSLDIWYNFNLESDGKISDENLPFINQEIERKYAGWWPFFPLMKLRDNSTIVITQPDRKYANVGVGLDIFPFEPVPTFDDDEQAVKFEIERELILGTSYPNIIRQAIEQHQELLITEEQFKEFLKLPYKQRGMAFDDFASKNFSHSSRVGGVNYFLFGNAPQYSFDINCFKETVYLPFEEIEIPAPIGWEKCLTTQYGNWREMKITHTHSESWSTDIPHAEYYKKLNPFND